jgi:hypothetical protein
MPRSSACRFIVAFVLAVALAVPCVQAGEAGSPRSRGAESLLSDLLDRAWAGLVSLWAENGCILDPDGRCATGPQPAADNGCILDPNGGCRSGS